MSINERITVIRREYELSQEEFGTRLGVKKSAISKLESGANNPTESMIKLICVTFRVNYLWLTEGEGPMMETMTTDALVEKYMAGESPVAISIMKAFAKLPDEEWVKLRDLIDRVKKEGHP